MNTRDLEIGKKIKQLRKGKMTQPELAAKIGKTESSIRKYEKGLITIPLNVLEKIASALGVTAFDLMGAEYWDKKYPDLAKDNKEYEGFIDYLNSLGYIVKDHSFSVQIPIKEFEKGGKMDIVPEEYKQSGFVPGESHCLELIKDGKSFILEDEEFSDMLKDTKDMIAFKLWQKSQESK